MENALYHPEWGYYTRTDRLRVGRSGDFFTSVSVGPLFGRLLARRLHAFWEALDCPPEFHLLEPGPEGGQLALDILDAARTAHPRFHQAIRYHACEPAPAKRALLEARFDAAGATHARAVASASEIRGRFGAVLANEVLDALPVRLVTFQDGDWVERHVTSGDNTLAWIDRPISHPALADAVASLGRAFPDGYTTEFCLHHDRFLAPLVATLDHALLTFIDYGFSRTDLYLPSRTEGTLRTYGHHQSGHDPLVCPGCHDITAHVDFTAVLGTGRRLGLKAVGFTRQERYLTTLSEPILHDLEPKSPDTTTFIRQFQTLTHPAMLGTRFHVLEFLKNAPLPSSDPFRFDPGGLKHLDPDS